MSHAGPSGPQPLLARTSPRAGVVERRGPPARPRAPLTPSWSSPLPPLAAPGDGLASLSTMALITLLPVRLRDAHTVDRGHGKHTTPLRHVGRAQRQRALDRYFAPHAGLRMGQPTRTALDGLLRTVRNALAAELSVTQACLFDTVVGAALHTPHDPRAVAREGTAPSPLTLAEGLLYVILRTRAVCATPATVDEEEAEELEHAAVWDDRVKRAGWHEDGLLHPPDPLHPGEAAPMMSGAGDVNSSSESTALQRVRVEGVAGCAASSQAQPKQKSSRSGSRRSDEEEAAGYLRRRRPCHAHTHEPRCWLSAVTVALAENSNAVRSSLRWSCVPDPVVSATLDRGDGLATVMWRQALGGPAGELEPFSESAAGLRDACDALLAGSATRVGGGLSTLSPGGGWAGLGCGREDAVEALFHREESHGGGAAGARSTAREPSQAGPAADRAVGCEERKGAALSAAAPERPRTVLERHHPADTPVCAMVHTALHRCFVGLPDPYLLTLVHAPAHDAVGSPRSRAGYGASAAAAASAAPARSDSGWRTARGEQVGWGGGSDKDDVATSTAEPFVRVRPEFLSECCDAAAVKDTMPTPSSSSSCSPNATQARKKQRTDTAAAERPTTTTATSLLSSSMQVGFTSGFAALLSWASEVGTLYLRLARLCEVAEHRAHQPGLGSYGRASLEALWVGLGALRRAVTEMEERPGGWHHVGFGELLDAQQRLQPLRTQLVALADVFHVTAAPSWRAAAVLPLLSSATLLSRLYRYFSVRCLNACREAGEAGQLDGSGERRATVEFDPSSDSTGADEEEDAGSAGDERAALAASQGAWSEALEVGSCGSLHTAARARRRRRRHRQKRRLSRAFDPLAFVLESAMRPLHAMMHGWLTRGELADPHDEFFIVPAHGATTSGYTLDTSAHRLPTFLSADTAADVLHAGVSLRVLRAAATHIAGSATLQLHRLSSFGDEKGDAEEDLAARSDAHLMQTVMHAFTSALMGHDTAFARAYPMPTVAPLAAVRHPRLAATAETGSLQYWQAYYTACNSILLAAVSEEESGTAWGHAGSVEGTAGSNGGGGGGRTGSALSLTGEPVEPVPGAAAPPSPPGDPSVASATASHVTVMMLSDEESEMAYTRTEKSGGRVEEEEKKKGSPAHQLRAPFSRVSGGPFRIDDVGAGAGLENVLRLRGAAARAVGGARASAASTTSVASSRVTTALYGAITEELRQVVHVAAQREAEEALAQSTMRLTYEREVLAHKRAARLREWRGLRAALRVERDLAMRSMVDDLTDAYAAARARLCAGQPQGGAEEVHGGSDSAATEHLLVVHVNPLLGKFVEPLRLEARRAPPATPAISLDVLGPGPEAEGSHRHSRMPSGVTGGYTVGFAEAPAAVVGETAPAAPSLLEGCTGDGGVEPLAPVGATAATATTAAALPLHSQRRYAAPPGSVLAHRSVASPSRREAEEAGHGQRATHCDPASTEPSRGAAVHLGDVTARALAAVVAATAATPTAAVAAAATATTPGAMNESVAAPEYLVDRNEEKTPVGEVVRCDAGGFHHPDEKYRIADINDDEYLAKRVGPRQYDYAERDALLAQLAEQQVRQSEASVASPTYVEHCLAVARARLAPAPAKPHPPTASVDAGGSAGDDQWAHDADAPDVWQSERIAAALAAGSPAVLAEPFDSREALTTLPTTTTTTTLAPLLWCSRYYASLAACTARYLTHKALQLMLLPPYGTLHRLLTQLLDVCLMQHGGAAARLTDAWATALARTADSDPDGRSCTCVAHQPMHPRDARAMVRVLNAAFTREWHLRAPAGGDQVVEVAWTLAAVTAAPRTRDDDDEEEEADSRRCRELDHQGGGRDDEEGHIGISGPLGLLSALRLTCKMPTGPADDAPVWGRGAGNRSGRGVEGGGGALGAFYRLLPANVMESCGELFRTLLFWKTVEVLTTRTWREGLASGERDAFFLCSTVRHLLLTLQQHVWQGLAALCAEHRRSLQFGSGVLFSYPSLSAFTEDHRRFLVECHFNALLGPAFAPCQQLVHRVLRVTEEAGEVLAEANTEMVAATRRAMAAFHALVESDSASESDDDGGGGKAAAVGGEPSHPTLQQYLDSARHSRPGRSSGEARARAEAHAQSQDQREGPAVPGDELADLDAAYARCLATATGTLEPDDGTSRGETSASDAEGVEHAAAVASGQSPTPAEKKAARRKGRGGAGGARRGRRGATGRTERHRSGTSGALSTAGAATSSRRHVSLGPASWRGVGSAGGKPSTATAAARGTQPPRRSRSSATLRPRAGVAVVAARRHSAITPSTITSTHGEEQEQQASAERAKAEAQRECRRAILMSIARRTIAEAHEATRRRVRDEVRARLRTLVGIVRSLLGALVAVRRVCVTALHEDAPGDEEARAGDSDVPVQWTADGVGRGGVSRWADLGYDNVLWGEDESTAWGGGGQPYVTDGAQSGPSAEQRQRLAWAAYRRRALHRRMDRLTSLVRVVSETLASLEHKQ